MRSKSSRTKLDQSCIIYSILVLSYLIPMTTQQKIEAIQENIADKTLSPWCRYKISWWDFEILLSHDYEDWLEFDVRETETNEIIRVEYSILRDKKIEVIWHPVSLARVLTALSYISAKVYLTQYEEGYKTKIETEEWDKFYRQLINEDKTDASLFDQSDETIEAIGKLLWYNK